MSELIEKLEKLNADDRWQSTPELPTDICRALFGKFLNRQIDRIEKALDGDINAALALVEERLPGCGINMQTSFGPDRIYRVVIQTEVRGSVLGISEDAATLPLALIGALLRALQEKDNTDGK